jgi:hypothetical protein
MKQEGYLEIKDEYEPIISEGGGGGISDGWTDRIKVGGGSSNIPLN